MPISREEVILGYRLVLGRLPESEEVIQAHAAAHDSAEAFGQSLLACDEAVRRAAHLTHPQLLRRMGLTEADVADLRAAAACEWPPPRPGFVSDFTGIYTRLSLVGLPPGHDGRHCALPIPSDFHAEAVEWLALLRALGASPTRFVMAELGAGWGPWTAAAHALARRQGVAERRFYAVEAGRRNLERLRLHLADNAIPEEEVVVLDAVLSEGPGEVFWTEPSESMGPDYGNRARRPGEPDYRGLDTAAGTVARPGLPLAEFLAREPRWDFVHMDLQGWEERLCRAALPTLQERVRFLLVATHSKALDAACFDLFHAAGWHMLANLGPVAGHAPGAPSVEALTICDGTQFWRNPRLVP
ncbi:MAG: hypothetical protein N3D18_14730 [Roseococcus sp.]|nr:hypothetical protein [Roseococcus sp.]